MGNKKRNRRVEETNAELELALQARVEEKVLENREDDELFVVDRSGSKTSRRKIEKEKTRKEMGVLPSKTEEHLVRKKIKEVLSRDKNDHVKGGEATAIGTHPLDIWGEESHEEGSLEASKNRRAKLTRRPNSIVSGKAMKVIGNGFSYNPASVYHQQALAKAVELETKKLDSQRYNNSNLVGIGASMVESQANGDVSSESDIDSGSDSESESEEGLENNGEEGEDDRNGWKMKAKTKVNEKISIAQRNKQKAHKALLTLHKREKALKGINKQIDNLPGLLKALEKNEEQTDNKRARIRALQEKTAKEKRHELTYEDGGEVPLSDEIGGSLRTLIPKGSDVKSLSRSYDRAGKTSRNNNTNNKKGHHPHRAPNLKWIPRIRGPHKFE